MTGSLSPSAANLPTATAVRGKRLYITDGGLDEPHDAQVQSGKIDLGALLSHRAPGSSQRAWPAGMPPGDPCRYPSQPRLPHHRHCHAGPANCATTAIASAPARSDSFPTTNACAASCRRRPHWPWREAAGRPPTNAITRPPVCGQSLLGRPEESGSRRRPRARRRGPGMRSGPTAVAGPGVHRRNPLAVSQRTSPSSQSSRPIVRAVKSQYLVERPAVRDCLKMARASTPLVPQLPPHPAHVLLPPE